MLDSVEEIIYGRLLGRLRVAQEMTGSIPFSILPLIEEDFDAYAAGEILECDLEQVAKERMERQKRQIEGMEVPPEDLYDFYRRLSERRRTGAMPVTLESIWELLANCRYLRDLGCELVPGTNEKVLRLAGIPGIPRGCCLTGDRAVLETGIPGLECELHLATYLDPVFERLMEAVLEAAEPPISVAPLALDAYRPVEALVVKTEQGERLVTGLADLEGVRLADEAPQAGKLPDFEKELKSRLKGIEKDVVAYERSVYNRVLKINETAAKTQRWLEWFVAYHYIRSLAMIGVRDGDLFWEVVQILDEHLGTKDVVSIDMETDSLKELFESFAKPFFELNIPKLGRTAPISVPILLCKAGLDVAHREAESLLKDHRKSEITVWRVKERLKRRVTERRTF
jgi:hypothetical protein